MLLPTGLYVGPLFSFLVFFIHTFFLIKKYAKTQGRTMLLPTGLYAGPPFCRAEAFFIFGVFGVFVVLGEEMGELLT